MPRSRVWIFVAILGLYLTLRGYHSRDGDQAYRLPLLLNQQDPKVFADDPFVRAFDGFNPHRGYLTLLDVTSRVTGLSGALLFWFVATFAATAFGIDRIARTLWPERGPWVGVVAFGMVLAAKAGNIGTNHLFEAILLDRLMGFALGWVALSECLARPDRGWWTGGVLLGIAGWIHPTVGLQLALTLIASWMLWGLSGRTWKRPIEAIGILALAQLPNLMRSMAQSKALFEGLPTEDFTLLTAWLQSPQHMLPSTWRLLQWQAWFGYAGLGLFSLFRIGLPANGSGQGLPEARKRFTYVVSVNLLSLFVAYVAIEWLHNLKVTVFQPFRMATIARGLATLAIAGRVVELGQSGTTWGRLRASLLVAGVFGDGLMLAVAVFEGVVSLVPGRWSVAAGAGALGWGVWYLFRHDTESGHWVLLAVVGGNLVIDRWLRRGIGSRLMVGGAQLIWICWVVPIVALMAPFVLDPANPTQARWLGEIAGRCRFWALPTDDVERLAVWCRENTPKDASFIGPPGPKTFRLWSERSLAFNRSGSPYAAKGLADWSTRYFDHVGHKGTIAEFVRLYLDGRHDLERRYDQLTDADLAGLARRQGASYILAGSKRKPAKDSPLELLCVDGRYAVFRIR